MTSKFKHEDEILAVVRTFEDATIGREEWTHAEHLVVAIFYLSQYDLETATGRMRHGILNLLRNGFEVDLEKEMPYHETLTVFWMRTIAAFNAQKNGNSLLDRANEVITLFDKDHPLKFYSRERLFSDGARTNYLEGDL